jgi:hypothetical protein
MNTVSTRTSTERPRSMPAWSRSVRSLPVLTRLIHGRTCTCIYTQMSTNLCCIDICGHTMTGRVLSGINPCTIRIHPCSSIENIRTRWSQSLHGHFGGYTVPRVLYTEPARLIFVRDDPGENVFCAHSRMVPDDARCLHGLYTVYHGLSRATTNCHGSSRIDCPRWSGVSSVNVLENKDAGSPRMTKILHPASTGIWSGNLQKGLKLSNFYIHVLVNTFLKNP